MTNKPPGKNAIFFVFLTVLINMIGFGVIMPVMPQLIMEITGDGLAEAARWGGKLSFVYALMQFFLSPVMGGLSDRFGRRPIILGSLAAYSMDFLLMAIAPSIALLLLARVLAGAFSATFSTASAFIADISPPDKRAANFGLLGAAFGLGFIIGPGIGGIIADMYGTRAPFYFVAMLGAANFVYGFFFLPETLAKENRRKFELSRANALGNFLEFKKYPIILPIAGAILLAELAHWVYPSTWAYFAGQKFSWSPSSIGFSLMAVGLSAAIVQGGLTRIIIPKIGERNAAFLGVFVAIISYTCFAFAPSGWMIYPIIAVSALAGLTQPSLQGIMSRTVPANAQGELQGAIASVHGLSMMFGPVIMTQTFALFSEEGAPVYFPGAAFLLAAALTGFALIPLFSAIGRIRNESDQAEPTV